LALRLKAGGFELRTESPDSRRLKGRVAVDQVFELRYMIQQGRMNMMPFLFAGERALVRLA